MGYRYIDMNTETQIIDYGSISISPDMNSIYAWIESHGFKQAEFKKGRDYISTYWGARTIVFKLIERENYRTYYIIGPKGSLIALEIAIEDNKILYDFYSPIWLFGIWTIKLKLKPDAPWYASYLSVGYKIQEKFEKRFNMLL